MATQPIPETVTIPGQVVYDALVRMAAAEHLLIRIADSMSGDVTDELLNTSANLFVAAFGRIFYEDDSVNELFDRADEEALALMATCLDLKKAVSA
ncbi:MAG: hypothetical protein ACR2MU_02795 [Gaiellaceae bacterium]